MNVVHSQRERTIATVRATRAHFPYFDFSSATNATYAVMASSFDVPSRFFHASHFALPLKSIIPGRAVFTSPTFACLNSAYSSSISSFVVYPSFAVFAQSSRRRVASRRRVGASDRRRDRRTSFTALIASAAALNSSSVAMTIDDGCRCATRCAAHRRARARLRAPIARARCDGRERAMRARARRVGARRVALARAAIAMTMMASAAAVDCRQITNERTNLARPISTRRRMNTTEYI